jgi:hypothetical protein
VEVVAVRRGDARRVLSAMLEQEQAVIDQLIDGTLGNYTYDAAHGMVLQRVETGRQGVARIIDASLKIWP